MKLLLKPQQVFLLDVEYKSEIESELPYVLYLLYTILVFSPLLQYL